MRIRYGLPFFAFSCLFTFFLGLCLAKAEPAVFWASDPVEPGEVVLFAGVDLDEISNVQVRRLQDSIGSSGQDLLDLPSQIVERSGTSIKVKLPADIPSGVIAYELLMRRGNSILGLLNGPTIYWRQGDLGADASPGGWVRVMGRNISRGNGAILLLKPAQGAPVQLNKIIGDLWDAQFELPKDLPMGSYSLELWNGQGDVRAVAPVGQLLVRSKIGFPDHWVDAREFGARGNAKDDDTESIRAALRKLEQLGGGTLFIPRGTYLLSGQLTIPRYVVVHGESSKLSVLLLKDAEAPPSPLIQGRSDFRLENFTIMTTRHGHVVSGGFLADGQIVEAANIGIDRLTIRASMFRGHLKTEQAATFLTAAMTRSPPRGPDMIRLAGENISITNSDIYGSVNPLYLQSPRFSVVRGNRFAIGRYGWYSITNPDGFIMEDNEIYGVDQEGSGGGINTLFGPGRAIAQNVLMKNNKFSLLMGQDAEGITSDGPGGCYYGPVLIVRGTKTAKLMQKSSEEPGCRRAGGLAILSGYGVGAYAGVSKIEGDVVSLTESFPVTTNETSVAVLTPMHRRYVLVGNEFRDAGVAIQFYGSSWDQIAVGNSSTRTGGMIVDGRSYGKYYQPALYTQFLDNSIEAGTVGGLTFYVPADAVLKAMGSPVPPNTAPLVRGVIMRKNRLRGNATIEIQGKDGINPSIVDAIIEHNSVEDVDVGVKIDAGATRVLIGENFFKRTKVPTVNQQKH
ncbi:hypothetical protein CO669_26010 [Bradyrhizobium sp. Y36]|uniref:glycosyl hydrolase family 28-related protein n=1 Tax=Bradyrhizobium sp. Y36 TaxID=2035447 RepID=UPI000BE7AB44|nr:glycosyl hydrolase family 28-related protein [Bradyrhizobium sp. Y36]PDT87312.1 hypothetical protein CO669_26010 [Bradyrhizobium sp. Y36]